MISSKLLPVLYEENTVQRGHMPPISRAPMSKSSRLSTVASLSIEGVHVEDPEYVPFKDLNNDTTL